MSIPRLYTIVDAEVCRAHAVTPAQVAFELAAAGATLIQYRDKLSPPQQILTNAAAIRQAAPTATLILNDRPDLAQLAHFDGVHLGQTDLSPADARQILGPQAIIGLSTHTPSQLLAAIDTPTDYLAIGPIFATTTKPDAEHPVGLETLRHIRTLTTKPLVAIGGITLANAPQVLAAGADSIAIISALFSPGSTIAQNARAFLDQICSLSTDKLSTDRSSPLVPRTIPTTTK
jgi:thiamine-phosphate pyrophosphorylase